MTDPKLVEMAREIVRDYQNSKYCGDLWNPWFLIGLIEKALQAYLLQESAVLVEAMKRASRNIQIDILEEDEHPALTLERAIESFEKKHGGVV